MLKAIKKLLTSNNPAPPWFHVHTYDGAAKLDLCGWLEQFFIRCQVKRKIEQSICMIQTDPTFDYIHSIGKGLIPIDPTHECRNRPKNDNLNAVGIAGLSASMEPPSAIDLPVDTDALCADFHHSKLFPYIDITLWQRIKGYKISEQPLLDALEMSAAEIKPLQDKMDLVLSSDYLMALNQRVKDEGYGGLAPGSL